MIRLSLSLALMLACAGTALAGDKNDPKEYAYHAKIAKAGEERGAAIAEELKNLGDHEWAGVYVSGFRHTQEIFAVAPQSGFRYRWVGGCMGVFDQYHGTVTSRNGCLQLDYTFKNDPHASLEKSTQALRLVPWGARLYLVPATDFIGFCNAVNDGTEPRNDLERGSRCLLRSGDEKKSVSGFPDVPQEYRSYLLDKPVEAEIVSVGKATTRGAVGHIPFIVTPVTLSRGNDSGLRAGIELHRIEGDDPLYWLRITKADPDHCEAVVSQMSDDKIPGPQLGWRFSTLRPARQLAATKANVKKSDARALPESSLKPNPAVQSICPPNRNQPLKNRVRGHR